MPTILLALTAAVFAARSIMIVRAARPLLAGTTLIPALDWATVSLAMLLVASIAPLLAASSAAQDQLWYWSAVLAGCPLISVLGARRPTNRVWNGFIILPLIAVLGWPAVTSFFYLPEFPPIIVQLPVFIGFALVMVMGCGNYMGTRYTTPALLLFAGTALIVIPFYSGLQQKQLMTYPLRQAGAIMLGSVTLLVQWQSLRETVAESLLDRLWFDFRDTFGIVWSIRIQERINQTATAENWPCRLGPDGFFWDDELIDQSRAHALLKIDHAVRWLLRRFVDPPWLDARLKTTFQPPHHISSQPSDSQSFPADHSC